MAQWLEMKLYFVCNETSLVISDGQTYILFSLEERASMILRISSSRAILSSSCCHQGFFSVPCQGIRFGCSSCGQSCAGANAGANTCTCGTCTSTCHWFSRDEIRRSFFLQSAILINFARFREGHFCRGKSLKG